MEHTYAHLVYSSPQFFVSFEIFNKVNWKKNMNQLVTKIFFCFIYISYIIFCYFLIYKIIHCTYLEFSNYRYMTFKIILRLKFMDLKLPNNHILLETGDQQISSCWPKVTILCNWNLKSFPATIYRFKQYTKDCKSHLFSNRKLTSP